MLAIALFGAPLPFLANLTNKCNGISCFASLSAIRSVRQSAPSPQVRTTSNSSLNQPCGVLELRDYSIYADNLNIFIKVSTEMAASRARHYRLLGAFLCDTGGDVSRVVHLYHFKDFNARDAARRAAKRDPDMVEVTNTLRPYIRTKDSTILRQAAPLYSALGMACASAAPAPVAHSAAGYEQQVGQQEQAVFELRQYRFTPGTDAVNKWISTCSTALPAKQRVDSTGVPLLMAYSDVGTLNTAVELWRYPSAQRLIDVCDTTRAVAEWRAAKQVLYPLMQSFNISFLHALPFSEWK